MFTLSPAAWLASLTTFMVLTAGAQTTTASSPSPAEPRSLSYSSAMEGYKPFADEKPIPWAAANSTVNQRGGWRAYAQEASGDSKDGEQGKTSGDADPHAGHSMPKATPSKEKP